LFVTFLKLVCAAFVGTSRHPIAVER